MKKAAAKPPQPTKKKNGSGSESEKKKKKPPAPAPKKSDPYYEMETENLNVREPCLLQFVPRAFFAMLSGHKVLKKKKKSMIQFFVHCLCLEERKPLLATLPDFSIRCFFFNPRNVHKDLYFFLNTVIDYSLNCLVPGNSLTHKIDAESLND